MAMHRRLAKELPLLRAKTLLRDGLAVEEGQAETAGAALSSRFVALLAGPRDTPYEGGVFRLQVAVPAQYPLEPPSIRFETRIFHPNVGRGHTPGAICLDILRKEAWSPALTLERTLLSIASLLADPNPASPMDSEAARLYENNRAAYDRRVREWVRTHAAPSGVAGATYIGDLGSADDEAPQQPPAAAEATLAVAPAAPPPQAAEAAPPMRAAEAGVGILAPIVIDLSDGEDEGAAGGAGPAAKRLRAA